jgi:uncharacterized membrane protein
MNPPFREGHGYAGFGQGGPGALGWAIFALELLIGLGVAWLVASLVVGRLGRTSPAPAVAESQPLETLHMRYARGEIKRDEYLQARADLGGEPTD